MNLRLRPWVGRANPGVEQKGVTLRDNTRLTQDMFVVSGVERSKIKTYHLRLIVQNYGQMPALNSMTRSSIRRNEPPTETHVDPVESVNSVFALMPTERISQELNTPAEWMHDMLDGKIKLYVLFRVDYEYQDKKGYYEMLGEFVGVHIETRYSKAD